jgi:hypothetical protein
MHTLPFLVESFPKTPRTQSQASGSVDLIYLYNILGWSSFPSIHPVIHPSKFLVPEEEDDGGTAQCPKVTGTH